MSKKRTIFCGAISVTAVICLVLLSNPLRRTDAGVRRWMERKTPMGSSLNNVEALAFKSKWRVRHHFGRPPIDQAHYGTYLQGDLGRYWSVPFFTYVTVFWCFDTNNHLTDIQVWKTTDGL